METAYQTLKVNAATGFANVISAIGSDPKKAFNVYLAERTHKRLANATKSQGGEATAQQYYDLAKALYPYSTYFDGAKKDTK